MARIGHSLKFYRATEKSLLVLHSFGASCTDRVLARCAAQQMSFFVESRGFFHRFRSYDGKIGAKSRRTRAHRLHPARMEMIEG